MNEPAEYKFLPLTLSMETLGGLATLLVKRGTPLPTTRKQQFSTASDNQKAVSISIFYGESPVAKKNIPLGKLELDNIPKVPRGEAKVNIQFEVNDKYQVTVTATVMESGKTVSSARNQFNPELSKEKIDEMLRMAIDEQHEDQSIAKRVEVKNAANNLIVRAEEYLLSQQKYVLRSDVDSQIEETIASLGLALQDDNVGMIEDKSKRLRELIPNTTVDLGAFFGASNNMFEGLFGSGQPQKRKTASSIGGRQQSQETARPSPKDIGSTEEIVKPKEGIFSTGQHFDANRVVRDLFATAAMNIVVIDAYIGEDVLNLLTVKKDGVHVRLLTGKVSPAFLTLARNFNRQYKNLEIRSSNIFHDRFVFIDDKDFYHFGASLEHLGNRTFMFAKIEEPIVIKALKAQWKIGWEQATVALEKRGLCDLT